MARIALEGCLLRRYHDCPTSPAISCLHDLYGSIVRRLSKEQVQSVRSVLRAVRKLCPPIEVPWCSDVLLQRQKTSKAADCLQMTSKEAKWRELDRERHASAEQLHLSG